MERITRRTFLKVAAATGATAVAAGSLTGVTHRSLASPASAALEERWVPSVCLQCPAGCGIIVRVINGRAVKIEGNPIHPINRGRLCPKGQSGLQILYDPDRIKAPMKRVGERGAGKWARISWEEAIATVAERLRTLREQGEAHTLVLMGGRYRGQMSTLFGRFLEAYGSPNDVGHSSICADGTPIAHYLTQGWKAYAGYDWDNTNYLICFGGGFVEAWRPTVRLLRAYGHMRRGRLGVRAKIVQVEPRFSVSAIKADEWIPIRPGTDAALALGMAHVIVKEGLYDKNFVAEHTFGFEDWTDEQGKTHLGFKTLVLRDYPPERAAEITGVPARTIERLAREFATTRPAIAAGERGISMQANGVFTRMAIHALNALVGSIDIPGGVLLQRNPPLTALPKVVKDVIAAQGLAQPRIDYAGTARYPLAGKVYQDMPDRILNGDPYPVNALLLYYTNPMFSSPDAGRWRDAIRQVPFVVSFSPFLDETTAHADLILPDHSYLERWQDDVIYPSLGYPVWALRQPVVEPLYDTRNAGDVLIDVAHAIGGSVAASFPWPDLMDFLRFRARGVWEAKRGSFTAQTFDEWWTEFQRRGVWADPAYRFGQWKEVFQTPSGKFEFFSQTLEHKLAALAEKEAKKHGTTAEPEMETMLKGLALEARGDPLFMPHYEPIRQVGDPKAYPFVLITYKLVTHAEGRGGNVPNLQDMLGVHVQEKWDSWVEINPEVGQELGLADGDAVWVESVLGRIRTRVRLWPVHPETVAMPFELGHRVYGRWAQGRGVNPNEIIANENDRLGGLAAWFSTRVKVYKV